MQNQRNVLIAVLLTGLILFGWDYGVRYFYPQANKPAVEAAKTTSASEVIAPELGGPAKVELKAALASSSRVPIAAPGVSGSINTQGAVVDDITTNRHREVQAEDSGPARILSPVGTPGQNFAQFGWIGKGVELPNADTVWAAPVGAKLTAETPVTLTWANSTGQQFSITYAVDDDYLITATQKVVNRGAAPVTMQNFALLNRTNKNASASTFNVHSGPFGAFDSAVNFSVDYDDLQETGVQRNEGRANWLGFTDIYWMTALIPGVAPESTDYRSLGNHLFRADVLYKPVEIGVDKEVTLQTRLFAGAKESAVLDRYEENGIEKFGLAIDWGWFRWFEKPIFMLLDALFRTVGNFGVAIIFLTIIVRGIMFPVAQRQFKSMAAMRAVQPKVKVLQERYKDDRETLQKEMMALYKQEGVNPLAGCLPMFIQIPIFFALYKVLTLTIEMRHQPFALWIHDLSAPDPLHILNLFGLLPYTPPAFLGIGILALLLGFTMWLQFKLNPAAPDPMQQKMFEIMPWIMMFIMAPFAAGLLIYWITSNVLTIAQQKFLYSRHPQLREQAEKEAQATKRAKK